MSGKVNDLNKDISNNVDLEESYDSKKANKYMKEAIKQAKKAASIGEVPIGCVIVYQDNIIGRLFLLSVERFMTEMGISWQQMKRFIHWY